MKNNIDLNRAVEISDGIFWVGAGGKSFLSRNCYLRQFSGGGKDVNLIIDPGPPVDLEAITAKIVDVIGAGKHINIVFVNHQDPDVTGNVSYFTTVNPACMVMSTEDTWRLISLYGLNANRFRAVESFSRMRASLPSGHRLQFVPTPFCHFRGACMLYDLESRILFSGDLLGGIAAPGLYATENNWPGIKAFHQLYMPSNDAIRLAVQRIRKLDPAPLMIAPQHGGIIQQPLIDMFLDRLEELPVGLDILVSLQDKLPLLLDAVNEIILAVRSLVGADKMAGIMKMFHSDGSYPSFFVLSKDDRVLEIKGEPFETMEALVKTIYRELDAQGKNTMTVRILKILLDRNLPPFDILLAKETGAQVEFIEED